MKKKGTRDEPHRKLLPNELAIEILEGYHPRHVRLLIHQAGSEEALQKIAVPALSKEQHQVHQRGGAVRILREPDAPATVHIHDCWFRLSVSPAHISSIPYFNRGASAQASKGKERKT